MTKAEIIARLQNGETMDDIAAEISTMMTQAEDEYAAIQKAEAKEKAKTTEKIKDTEALNDHLHAYISKWYPDITSEENPCSAEMLIDMFEMAHRATKIAFAETPQIKIIHPSEASKFFGHLVETL